MLALGRALMGRPRLLLLDEPSLGLAPMLVREIFRVLVELRQRGLSILLVEQNVRAALQVSDYGYVLEMGEVAAEGPGHSAGAGPADFGNLSGAAATHDASHAVNALGRRSAVCCSCRGTGCLPKGCGRTLLVPGGAGVGRRQRGQMQAWVDAGVGRCRRVWRLARRHGR